MDPGLTLCSLCSGSRCLYFLTHFAICPILEREFILILISWVVFFSSGFFWGGEEWGKGQGLLLHRLSLNSYSSTSSFGIYRCVRYYMYPLSNTFKACSLILFIKKILHVFLQEVGWHMPQCTCGGQSRALRNGFSFTFPGVLGFTPRLSGLVQAFYLALLLAAWLLWSLLRQGLMRSLFHLLRLTWQVCTIIPCLCSAGDQTWNLMYARQAVYQQSYKPSPFLCCSWQEVKLLEVSSRKKSIPYIY